VRERKRRWEKDGLKDDDDDDEKNMKKVLSSLAVCVMK
jgi:hypothetical protein